MPLTRPPPAAKWGRELVNVVTLVCIVMLNPAASVLMPPDSATVILAVLGTPIRLAGTTALNRLTLTKVVCRAAPFHRTVAPLANPAPLTISVKPALPAVAEDGERLVSDGADTVMLTLP